MFNKVPEIVALAPRMVPTFPNTEKVPAQQFVREFVLLNMLRRVPDIVAPAPKIVPTLPSTVNVPLAS